MRGCRSARELEDGDAFDLRLEATLWVADITYIPTWACTKAFRSPENQGPINASHPIHRTQELPGSRLLELRSTRISTPAQSTKKTSRTGRCIDLFRRAIYWDLIANRRLLSDPRFSRLDPLENGYANS